MDSDQAWATIAQERRALADLLDALRPGQWKQPSLCRGWRVKDVVAHMTVGPTASAGEVAAAMIRSGMRFHVANQRLVQARADLPTGDLVALLRATAKSRFYPPGHDWHAPLTEVYLHRLDILIPLRIPVAGELAGWPDVLGLLTSPRARIGFVSGKLPRLTYAATDCGWTSGSGPRVEGTAEALALAIARRRARLDHLEGPGADRLRDWATS